MRIFTTARPYILTFHASGHSYRLSASETQRLLDEYPAVKAGPNRVILQGHNSAKAYDRSTLRPATLGGGAAFVIER